MGDDYENQNLSLDINSDSDKEEETKNRNVVEGEAFRKLQNLLANVIHQSKKPIVNKTCLQTRFFT